MFNLHATIPLPQGSWGEPVRLATDALLASFPAAQTRVYADRHCILAIDLAGQDAPTEALAALRHLGARLNPQGLTRVEVADDGADQASWTGHYAYGPSYLVAAWLAESAKLDAQLGYTGPISLHLRYEDEAQA